MAYVAPPPGSAAGSNPPPTYMDAVLVSTNSLNAADIAEAAKRFEVDKAIQDQQAVDRAFRNAADAAEATTRAAADTALQASIMERTTRTEHWRPGDLSWRFSTTALTGPPSALPEMSPSLVATSPSLGKVGRLSGTRVLVPRDVYRVEPGRKYFARWTVMRVVDTPDPDGDGVRAGIQWLDADDEGISLSTAVELKESTTLKRISGRVEMSAVISTSAGDGIDVVAPPGTIYCRPYVHVWGDQPVTDVEVIDWHDITYAAAYSPDLTAVEARLGAIESLELPARVDILETYHAGPTVAEYPTVADAAAATIGTSITTLSILRHDFPSGIAPDGYQRVLDGPATLRRFQSADGAWWESTTDVPNSRQLGGSGADDTDVIEALGSADMAIVNQTLVAPAGVDQEAVADVMFAGMGALEGVYRKQVISPRAAGTAVVAAGDLVPAVHLSALNAARAPVVVLVGDSIGTYDANNTGRQNMLAHMLEAKLRREFPTRTVTFYNRSIASTGYGNLAVGTMDGGLIADVDWFTNPSQAWLDYVEDLAPDAIFFAFGMNTGLSLGASAIKVVIDAINGWAKRPDLIFCTNLLPSMQTGTPSLSVPDEQIRRDQAAGLTRTLAQYYGYGVADFNRQFCIARDGFDPLASTIINEQHVVGGATSPWTCPEETIDFYCSCVIDCDEFTAGDDTKSITIGIGPGDVDWVRIVNSAGGNIQIARYVGYDLASSITILPRIDTGVAFPTGNRRFRFEVVGNNFSMWDGEDAVNGRYKAPIVSCNIMRLGGKFQPYIGLAAGNPNGMVTSEDIWFYVTKPREYKPTIKDGDLFGRGDGNGSTYNHPGNYLGAHVYGPVLNALPFVGAGPPYVSIAGDVTGYTNTTTSYAVMSDTFEMQPGSHTAKCEVDVKLSGIATGAVGGGPGAANFKLQAKIANVWTDIVGTEEQVGFSNIEANNTGASPAENINTTIPTIIGTGSRDSDGFYRVRLLGQIVTGAVSIFVGRVVAKMREAG